MRNFRKDLVRVDIEFLLDFTGSVKSWGILVDDSGKVASCQFKMKSHEAVTNSDRELIKLVLVHAVGFAIKN